MTFGVFSFFSVCISWFLTHIMFVHTRNEAIYPLPSWNVFSLLHSCWIFFLLSQWFNGFPHSVSECMCDLYGGKSGSKRILKHGISTRNLRNERLLPYGAVDVAFFSTTSSTQLTTAMNSNVIYNISEAISMYKFVRTKQHIRKMVKWAWKQL